MGGIVRPRPVAGIAARLAARAIVMVVAALASIGLSAATPLIGATRIGAGATHGCALVAGGVMCWGDNQYGQIGNGTRERALGATQVSGLEPGSGVLAVSTGYSSLHHCAVMSGGTVRCWGRNGSGQLGDGTFVDSLVPLTVPGLVDVAAVVTGGDHTCALTTTGGVKCWGGGGAGQLGDGNMQYSATPVTPLGLGSGVAEIAAGYRHMCARTQGGAVKCWGFNQFGQIGNGTIQVVASSPSDVSGLASGALALGAGYQHSCAGMVNGVKCWGWNMSGQLGNGTQTDSPIPVDAAGLGGAAQLALGQSHTCARDAVGAVRCWGSNLFGSLGNGQQGGSLVPVHVIASGVAELVAGDNSYCARFGGGDVWCWGEHSKGQLGMGADTRSFVPLDVAGLGAPMGVVSAGGGHTCAAAAAGIKCWGRNWMEEVGVPNGTQGLVTLPADVAGLPATPIDVRAGDHHTCAIVAGGALLCWGGAEFGQLGNGTTSPGHTPVPSAVIGLGSGVVDVSPGQFHTCAVANGGAKCWGDGAYGRLGDGTGASSTVPVQVSGLASGVAFVAAGVNHACALTTSGAVKCWGRNADGELGNGGSAPSLLPVDVSGLSAGVARIAAGYFHTCALSTAGGVSCWGVNNYGQLGNGSTASSRVPVPVAGLASGVVAIAAGEYHTCALRAVGDLLCWGSNGSGRLGNGTNTPYRELVPVATVGLALARVTHLTAGQSHTCVRNDLGGVQCWGDGIFGQLGNGGANSFPTPVRVVLDSRCAGFTDVSAGSSFCPNVAWLRNRGVTLGCLPGRYCPSAPVSRIAMAAFMNRLGNALAPQVVTVEDFPGALDPDARPRVCTTAAVPELAFGRRAIVDAIFSATAGQEAGFGVDVLASVDGGSVWRKLSSTTHRLVLPAGAWAGVRVQAEADLDVGRGVRFALAIDRAGFPAGPGLDDSECRLRVRLDNRNSPAVPY